MTLDKEEAVATAVETIGTSFGFQNYQHRRPPGLVGAEAVDRAAEVAARCARTVDTTL